MGGEADRARLRVDGGRLWESLMTMARIGATPDGGCRRLALTDEDRDALKLFEGWAADAGCEVARDRLGNSFAERPGADPDRPAIAVGSHLDTQPSGGRFDGAYGVLAALEIVRTLNDHGVRTLSPVVAVSWINEEGARFPQPTTGSATFSGALTVERALGQRASDAPMLGEEIERLGLAGAEEVGGRRIAAFFEAHIEQGMALERAGARVGIVTGGQGIRGVELTVTGRETHTGTTPMDARRDALVGAARIVEAVRELPDQVSGALATVSQLVVEPGSRSVVPGRASMVVDLRHPELDALDRLEEAAGTRAGEITAELGLEWERETFLRVDPVAFDAACLEALRTSAERIGHPHMDLVSGAGHDAMQIARAAPAALLFVPCRDGISHHPSEYAEPADLEAGCDVLLHAVLDRAGVAGSA